ncbi:hypothetical protein Dda_5935 [Drechslerella dactyloides]|uniref:Uncharacterized protein n=1 Tax=Drechslerella dactyloides TaxID=74499 RepID=A0AAD6IW45_DREDA|nr:hypothetical protein Dda_5935 [Drechslerella dactyloides]
MDKELLVMFGRSRELIRVVPSRPSYAERFQESHYDDGRLRQAAATLMSQTAQPAGKCTASQSASLPGSESVHACALVSGHYPVLLP